MAVTAGMVKELRDRTGAGMMDCKNALVETEGNMDKAIELLREKGLAKAAKKAGRVASQGLVQLAISTEGDRAAVIEVNCETDFAAKNEEFIAFVNTLADMALNTKTDDPEKFLTLKYKDEGSVEDALKNRIAKIGENMSIRRLITSLKTGVRHVGYVHGAGKIAAVIGLKTEAALDEVAVLGKDLAMQTASMSPRFIDESAVDPVYIENELRLYMQQAKNEGKPDKIAEKIASGRMKKELKEICLMEQKFVKDSEISVADYVNNAAAEIGKPVQVVEMIRFEMGEGIEKKEEDFAREVAKQMNN